MTVHPMLYWMLTGVFGALIAGSLARLMSLRGKSPELVRNRVDSLKTWWVIAPIFTMAILLGQFAVAILFTVIAWLGLSEFARLVPYRTEHRTLHLIAMALVPAHYVLICLGWSTATALFIPLGALLALSVSQTVAGRVEGFTQAVAGWYWGLILLAYGPSHAVLLWSLPEDACGQIGAVGWFLFLLTLTEMNDISQAFFGRHWGNRKIAPTVSPFKTWVGFIGGVVTTTVLAVGLAPLLTPFGASSDSMPYTNGTGLGSAVAAGLLISVAGFFGDINLSAVKRDAHVKDSGHLLPGQGGILDRIDSLTFTAPVFYVFVVWSTN